MGDPARPKKRLTVLQSQNGAGAEERPGWHWALITAFFCTVAWLLLAAVVNAVLGPARPLSAFVVNVVVLAASAALAGALAGRFGRLARGTHAAAGGALAATFGGALAWSQSSSEAAVHLWIATCVFLAGTGAGGAAVGFSLTRRRARP